MFCALYTVSHPFSSVAQFRVNLDWIDILKLALIIHANKLSNKNICITYLSFWFIRCFISNAGDMIHDYDALSFQEKQQTGRMTCSMKSLVATTARLTRWRVVIGVSELSRWRWIDDFGVINQRSTVRWRRKDGNFMLRQLEVNGSINHSQTGMCAKR